ncbi:MAG: hypothetical protein AAF721_08675 [Myxococcota bacterium]
MRVAAVGAALTLAGCGDERTNDPLGGVGVSGPPGQATTGSAGSTSQSGESGFEPDDGADGFPDDGSDDAPGDGLEGPPTEECGGDEFSFNASPPNLMILLDRSGSMTGDVNGSSDNRWEVATAAIEQVTLAFSSDIRFGLAIYSSCEPGGCSAGQIVVPIADNNAAAIHGWLNTTAAAGSLDGAGVDLGGKTLILCNSGFPETSTGVSLQALVGEPSLQDPERTNAVLLLTDGGESSECTDFINGPGGASELFGQNIPVRTFAVGMGGASEAQLGQIAIAGGTVVPYFADQAADLQMALQAIAATVAACTFTLDQVPDDLSELFVFFDGDPAGVPQDAMNGWSYDPASNTITFHGSACEAIESGATANIDIVYGCNLPPEG